MPLDSKFGRNYSLTVETSSGLELTIEPPFTIEFDIHRNILSSANTGQIRIFNLSKVNRDQIEFNIYNQGSFRRVILNAGYGTSLPVIFSGNISQAWSVREGTNFITQIECFDGGYGYNNAIIPSGLSFPQGTPNKVIIESLVSAMAPFFVLRGAVGNYEGVSQRPSVYTGSLVKLLTQLTGGGFFIDNNLAYALQNGECIVNSYPLIDSSTGLLGTPVREQNILTFDMIFEPRVQAGQIINLQSTGLNNQFASQTQAINGLYKVSSIRHRGMISGAVCGEAITTLGMYLGQNGPDGLTVVT